MVTSITNRPEIDLVNSIERIREELVLNQDADLLDQCGQICQEFLDMPDTVKPVLRDVGLV